MSSPDLQARTHQFRAALGSFATGVTIVTTRNSAGGGHLLADYRANGSTLMTYPGEVHISEYPL